MLRERANVRSATEICVTAHQTPLAPPAALPIKKFAAKYGLHPCTVWRAVRDGRLQYIRVGKRKLILPPVVQKEVPQKTGR
jgi:hypothetical protein